MTEKRFTLIYGIDENPFEWDIMDNEKDVLICRCNGKPICDLLNELAEEKEELKQRIKKHMEIELLKSEDYANCHNCKNDRSVHDGVALDGMCSIKGLMNIGGYFDTEYHKLPSGSLCPYWELEK